MRRLAAALAAALLCGACAGARPGAPGGAAAPGPPRFAELADRFADRALRQEGAGETRWALDSWRVVAALRRRDEEPRRRSAELETRLAADAERRFDAAIARLEDGRPDAARRELLLCLAADPDHAAALALLRTRVEPDVVTYTVAEGDSLEWIATTHYGDPGRAPIVARVNDLAPDARPVPGTVLTIPVIAPPKAPPPRQPAVLSPSETRREEGLVEEQLLKAEEYYNEGVRLFINQRLEEAIGAWKRALELNPGLEKARNDISKAERLKKKLEEYP